MATISPPCPSESLTAIVALTSVPDRRAGPWGTLRRLAARRAVVWSGLVALTLGGLVLAMRGLHPHALGAAFAHVHWPWVALAATSSIATIVASSLALRIVLGAAGLGPVPLRHVLAAKWIGQGANAVLPSRLGEAAPLLALRRHVPDAPGQSLRIAGSLAAQHLLEGAASFVLIVVAALVVPLPGVLAELRWVGLGLLVGGPPAILLLGRLGLLSHLERRLPKRIAHAAGSFLSGLSALAHRGPMLRAFIWHLLAISSRMAGVAALLLAFGIPVPLSATLVVFALLGVSALVPAAPGGFGLGQAAIVAPLGAAYGVAASSAFAFTVGLHAVGAIVAIAGGLVCLAHQRRAAPVLP